MADRAAFVRRFAGGDRAVADYLLTEILERQPDARRTFLLRTCVADSLDAELAAALTGRRDAGRVLRELEAENFLVASDEDEPGSYRYHGLLREFLRAELRRTRPRELRLLHGRSARWHWEHREPLAAYPAALAADDLPLADEIVGEAWHTLTFGAERLAAPEATQCRSFANLAAHATLTELLDGAGSVREVGPADGVLARIVGLARARLDGDWAHVDREARAVLALPPVGGSDLRTRGRVQRALALTGLGVAALGSDAPDARMHLEAGLGVARSLGMQRLVVDALAQLAVLEAAECRLPRSLELAEEALATAEENGLAAAPAVVAAHLAAGWARFHWDELDAALAHAELAQSIAVSGDATGSLAAAALAAAALAARGPMGAEAGLVRFRGAAVGRSAGVPPPPFAELVSASLPRLLAARGDLDAAADAARGGGVVFGLVRARLALARADAGAALAELAAAGPQLGSGSLALRIEAVVLEAVARRELGERDEPGHALERALALAGPSRIRRPFLDCGPAVRPLLVQLIRTGTAHRAAVGDVLAAFDRRAPGVDVTRAQLLAPLSERERAILRYLPTLMSNTEIAGELFVSTNTVKTHVRNIYRKLGATRRRDAVDRARRLQLL